ncbi:hypothetical protein [Anaeromyxobacter sp. Fw109-5]|uniref:hypothetical protein n=1 Tax=Anaeromyxobacter sp. (strain Fw109-5) TaxID=404589 RepID=UPI000158A66B|nr:hypothetical protein [Anaeromyxobacter sp. Fw109-5]ABS27662.1 conserved hypothetical protein [Anaeromyxobacter sp. Fw109-5]
MIRTLAPVTALALLLSASPARAADEAPRWTLDARAGLYAGAFDGWSVRRDSGTLLLAEGALTPELESGRFQLELPVRFAHRQTFGATLPETTGSVGVEPAYRVLRRLKLGAEAGVGGAWRPGWDDLYQRDALGEMPGTDRYGYFSWRAGVSLYAIPAPHQHLRIKYRYVSYSYVEDPAFDPAAPMHLTPRDNGQQQLEASWRILGERYATAFRVDYVHRQDFTLLARDAGTGATSGNPEQQLDSVEPSVEIELARLGGAVDVSLRYGYEVQRDAFQGYYSYQGQHPRLIVKSPLTDRLEAALRAEAWLRAYGADSKANTSDGARLFDRRFALGGELRYALGGGLAARAEAEWVTRDTNYPDYVPGVYPAGRYYDVRWSYDNARVIAGLEWRRPRASR